MTQHDVPLPQFRLIGNPRRQWNSKTKRLGNTFYQRFRIIGERQPRSVTLQTDKMTIARQRAWPFVESKVREQVLAARPALRATRQPVTELIEEHVADKRARGDGAEDCLRVERRLKRLFAGMKADRIGDLNEINLRSWLSGEMAKEEQPITLRTAKHYLATVRSLTRWLHKHGKIMSNPLQHVSLADFLKGDTTSTRKRAILTNEQMVTLLKVTGKSDTIFRCLDGTKRRWLYLIASQTGLRCRECHSLRPESFKLEGPEPEVVVHCTISKRRKEDHVRLSREFADLLRPWIATIPAGEKVFPGKAWYERGAAMLRADLAAAELPCMVGDAHVDFHSMRGFRVTSLVKAGLPLALIQKVVRLSSEALVQAYCKLSSADVTLAVESVRLPGVA